MSTEQLDSIYRKGCIAHLAFSVWGGRVKLPKGLIRADADPAFINATKYLVDRDCLRPIEKIRNEARSFIYNKTLPFYIPGLLFISRDIIPDVDRELERLKAKFMFEVSNFTANYNIFIDKAREKLNGLFNPLDYPKDIWKCFSFRWDFINFSAPDRTQILSAEICEREQSKYEQTMLEFRQTAMNTLRTKFAEMVDRVVERLSGERKVFKDTLVGNMKEFLDDFNKLNITDDTELSTQIERCKKILDGVDVNAIRDNETFRHNIANNMTTIQTELDKMMIDRPVRKLRKVG